MKLLQLLAITSLSLLMLISSGCATRGTVLKSDQTGNAQDELALENASVETAVIFATSDVEGNVLASIHGETGGLALLEAYYKVLKGELGDHVIWLDGGHLTSDQTQSSLFEKQGVEATLNSTQASSIHELGKIKLGVIGLQAASDLEQLKTFVVSEADRLRKEGAGLIALLTDLPISCLSSQTPKNIARAASVRKADEAQDFCEGALSKLLREIPAGTVNAAIVSGLHEQLHHYVFPRWSSQADGGIPVVSSSPRGGSVNVIYLSVRNGKVTSRIEGPVVMREHGRFHAMVVTSDPDTKAQILPLAEKRAQETRQILGKFNAQLDLAPRTESSLTNFLADVIKQETHVDAVIAPLGLVRYAETPQIAQGDFSLSDLKALLPVAVPIVSLSVKGDELKKLLQISETGMRGFSSVSGLKLSLLTFDADAPQTSPWGADRLLHAANSDGDDIQSNKSYQLAVPLALTQGADDWLRATEAMKLSERITQRGDLKAFVAQYLAQNGSVNEPEARLRFERSKGKQKGRARRRSRAKRQKKT